MGSNPLSGSIICPSVHPYGRLWDFLLFFIFLLTFSVGVQRVAMHLFRHRELVLEQKVTASEYTPPFLLWSITPLEYLGPPLSCLSNFL